MLSQATRLPAAFVRKAAKPYGTCQLAEGAPIADRTVVLIEDVVTTGGQLIESAKALRELGGRLRMRCASSTARPTVRLCSLARVFACTPCFGCRNSRQRLRNKAMDADAAPWLNTASPARVIAGR